MILVGTYTSTAYSPLHVVAPFLQQIVWFINHTGGSECHSPLQVNLNMDDGRCLGLMIRGGAEYGLGIYITGVDPGSAADAGALKVSQQLSLLHYKTCQTFPIL